MAKTVDERLRRIEIYLEDLTERDRISHFDTIMFLVYPLILWLPSVSYPKFIGYAILVLVFLLVLGFCRFALAYLRDDLKGRIEAVDHLVLSCCLSVTAFILYYRIWINLFGIFFWAPTPSEYIVIVLGYSCICALGLSAAGLIEAPRPFLRHFVASWFEKNVPRKYVAAQRPYHARPGWARVDVLVIKTGLCAIIATLGLQLVLSAPSYCGWWLGINSFYPLGCREIIGDAQWLVVLFATITTVWAWPKLRYRKILNTKRMVIFSVVGGVVISLLTGLVPNLEKSPDLMGEVWYGYPVAWLMRVVPESLREFWPRPYEVEFLPLVVDSIAYTIGLGALLFSTRIAKRESSLDSTTGSHSFP